MPIPRRNELLVIGRVCCVLAMAGWAFYALVFSFAPAQDFMVFHTAARAYLDGNLPLLFDGDAFTARLNANFGAWFVRPLDLHPWMYPPLFLLLMIPIGIVPFPVAYVVFLSVTFVALICALRCYVPRGYQRWLCAASLILSPATAFTIAVGQNSFMTTALLVGGFGLTVRSPLLAGVLLGILACKPQLWLLVPVALIAARAWRTLSSMIATVTVFALAALAVLGSEAWRRWLMLMLRPSALYQHWLQFGRLNGQSAYTDAVLLGVPVGTASILQALATLSCAVLVWWCFRVSGMRRDMQLAVLLTATILAAPHVANYDAVMITVAVSLFLCRALDDGFRFGDTWLIIIVWSIELLNPPQLVRVGLITPVVFWLFIAAMIARRRTALGGAPLVPQAAMRLALPTAVAGKGTG